MGLVIRARNEALDESVAIKLLREDIQLDAEHVERFLREAKAAVRLKSENVARIRDVGTLEDGRPYMVMELLEGLDLGKLLTDVGAIDSKRAVDLILQACDALAEAHALGIVHRDIKPTNLFVARRRDDTEVLKVLDFGISKVQSGSEMSLTQTSSVLGTPAYMSPEQMRSARTADPRSDIWALGTVLYELVEGRLPFDATNFAELCVMVSTEDPAPMTRAPHMERVIGRCLAKPTDQRYQNVGELATDLEPFASEPGRASRQVARIRRVLGIGGPSARDSTPLPMSRDLMQQPKVSTRDSIQKIVGVPPTPVPQHPAVKGGVWKSVVLLVVLFGVGIAAGLYVTRSNAGDTPAAHYDAGVESSTGGSAGSAEDSAATAEGSAATAEGSAASAGSADTGGRGAGGSGGSGDVNAMTGSDSAGSGSGSGSSGSSSAGDGPDPKKGPKKGPKKQPTGNNTTGANTGANAGSATVPAAGSGAGSATKKCDPFANSRGC